MGLGIKIPKSALTAGREKFASGDENENIELEPGKYMFQVAKIRAVDTKNGSQLVFDLNLVGEDKKGKVGVFYALTEDRIVYLFRVLALLGYDVSELDDSMLDEIAADIEANKPVVRVKVSKKDEFINYRIEKLVEDISFLGGSEEKESAVDTSAGKVTAGRSETVVKPAAAVVKPAATQVAKAPLKAAPKPAPAPAAPPTDEEAGIEEEVIPDEEAVVEEDATELKIGLKCKANLNAGVIDVEILDIHEAEGKVTAKGTDGRKYKFSIEKLM
jgi:hypothetical protein